MSAWKSFPEIDEELYSRQLYVLGHEVMQKMATADVLVSGMKGLGVEIAKNIILAGVKSVTVHDPNDAQWNDLSSQFYLSEDDVGQNRAEVSQRHLAKLNRYVQVIASTNGLTECFLSNFQVVVLTDSPLEEQLRISDFCHASNICFVLADTKGLTGQLFCDFGEHFTVYQPLEAEPVSAAIDHITQGNPGVLTVAYGDEQGQCDKFMDDDWVTFSEVKGMTQLNGSEARQIRVKGKYSLEVGDTSSFSPYKCGGIITEVKKPQEHSFKSLRDSMADPKIKTPSGGELPHFHALHAAFWALHVFRSELQRLPRPRDEEDADKMVELAQTLHVGQEALQKDLVRTFAYGCAGDLSPINSFIGGVAAQEVLKAASGKFTPLDQWLYFDAFDCLPEEEQLTAEDCAPRGSRYDGQVAVFGAGFQERLGKQKYFMVGAGAIGCELLKNFAMIGLATGQGGNITVTDMDTIEKSNLNRQFLFRPCHVSMQKSEVAATAIKLMNPNINVTAEQHQVGPDTEHIYGDDFFLGLDGVVSALDNWQARGYLDQRCVQCLRPLLDSGTNGTRGHVQVCVPFLSAAYGQAPDEDGREYPLCTLRYFPSSIEHTIQWARDQFEGLFKTAAEGVSEFLVDPSFLETQEVEALEMLELVKISLQEKPRSWEDCVAWARRLWERLFSHDIQQLLHKFPPEDKTSSGYPFWSRPKLCPHQLEFDCRNTTHMTFILAASRLFAQTHRLRVKEDEELARQILLGMHIPVPDQEVQKALGTPDQMRLAALREELAEQRQELGRHSALRSGLMKPIHFDKDDDSHLDFIVTAANLRADNFGITPADKLKAKKIVGRIVPAIATTTAAVAGLACLELYKLVWPHRHRSCYCCSSLRLWEPLLIRIQAESPQAVYKYHQKTWSCWDRIEVPGLDAEGEEITLRDLCDHIQREHGLVPRMLLYGKTILYAKYEKEELREHHLSFRLTERIRVTTGEPISEEHQRLVLLMVCEGEDADSHLPPVHVRF